MSSHRLNIRRRIAAIVLLTIACRSLVAIGWMLHMPGDVGAGLALPSVVICPQQSPELAAWLASEDHQHHHSDRGNSDAGFSLSVLDPTCAAWSTTALANLPLNATLNLGFASEIFATPQSYSSNGRLNVRAFSARAPPSFS